MKPNRVRLVSYNRGNNMLVSLVNKGNFDSRSQRLRDLIHAGHRLRVMHKEHGGRCSCGRLSCPGGGQHVLNSAPAISTDARLAQAMQRFDPSQFAFQLGTSLIEIVCGDSFACEMLGRIGNSLGQLNYVAPGRRFLFSADSRIVPVKGLYGENLSVSRVRYLPVEYWKVRGTARCLPEDWIIELKRETLDTISRSLREIRSVVNSLYQAQISNL